MAVRVFTPFISPVSPSISSSAIRSRSVRSRRSSQRRTSFAVDASPRRTLPSPIKGASPSILATTFSVTLKSERISRIVDSLTLSRSWSAPRRAGQAARGSVPHGFSSKASDGRSFSLVMTSSSSGVLAKGSPKRSCANTATFGISLSDPIVAEVA